MQFADVACALKTQTAIITAGSINDGKEKYIFKEELYNEHDIDDVIVYISFNNLSVCVKNFVGRRNWEGVICDIVNILFYVVFTTWSSNIWNPCVCECTRQ